MAQTFFFFWCRHSEDIQPASTLMELAPGVRHPLLLFSEVWENWVISYHHPQDPSCLPTADLPGVGHPDIRMSSREQCLLVPG